MSQGGSKSGRVASGSYHQSHEILPSLSVRHIDLRAPLSSQRTGLRVANDPDDFAHEFFVAPDGKAFADRLGGRTEVTLRDAFVDDYHLRCVSIVAKLKGASGEQRNLEGAKIIACDAGEHRVPVFVDRERAAFRNKSASNRVTTRVEWEIHAASGRLHAGRRFKPLFQLAEKFLKLLILIFRVGQRQVGDEDVVGIKARPYFLETEEALDEQSSANQQHERESDFADQEQAARARPAMAFAAASALFQRTDDVELRGLERGDDAEENAGKRGDSESKC